MIPSRTDMRRRLLILTAFLTLAAWPGSARAQGMNAANMNVPNLGTLAGATVNRPAANPGEPTLNLNDTFVAFLDSAIPRNVVGLRFDADYGNRQPMRSTYLFPKGAVPGAVGFPLPETRVDTLELTSYAEYSLDSWFSVFIEAPYRWINPEINGNQSGAGDMRYGLKICTWTDEAFLATILFRVYQPSARTETLGTSHWSIEPGLLAAYRFSENVHLEGEFRYWIPLTRDDFAGNILRYGAGLSYGQRKPNGFWYMPVVEGIGWTVLSGKTIVASSSDAFVIQEARDQTIFNGYLGVRVGYGKNTDMYIGYGRAFTGHAWARDMVRVEFRFSY
ncbi:MAG: transporter [Planctomycetes bacterium]|nr:transporter [Planctomycetota bacterium]